MLFTKPLSSVEFDDVVRFCESGSAEGFILEYKREMPDTDVIAKTVAAFANTYGGLLVVGVNAPQGKPVPPFEGVAVDAKRDYELQIEQVILGNVREPIFPETRVCPPKDGRTFILLRVPETLSTTSHGSEKSNICPYWTEFSPY